MLTIVNTFKSSKLHISAQTTTDLPSVYTYIGGTDRACFTFDVSDMPGLTALPGTAIRTGNHILVGLFNDASFIPNYNGNNERTITDGEVTVTDGSRTKVYFCLEDVVVGDAGYFYMNTGNIANNGRFQIQLFVVGM